ncbi:MAG: DUF3035 domain-containing protein [Alphaproteobacteria bacterium]|nr:DUF3035 domain-containing protein [Alphaproteobacteria bacterium]
MFERDPRRPRFLRRAGQALLCLGAAASLSACGDFRRAIGLDRPSPDEFAVESRAPLTIPPDFDLRPPEPGAARPQEKSTAEQARQALDTAGPGEPGKQASVGGLSFTGPAGGGDQTDPNAQVGANSLSSKLLGSQDGGAAVEKRETSTLKGVY